MLLSRTGKEGTEEGAAQCQLFFDPGVIEGMWEQEHPGGMMGYTSCLTASIVRQCMIAPGQPGMRQGMQRGLAAMRALHLEGYGKAGARTSSAALAFPIAMVAAELAKEITTFTEIDVPDPSRSAHGTGEGFGRSLLDHPGKPLCGKSRPARAADRARGCGGRLAWGAAWAVWPLADH